MPKSKAEINVSLTIDFNGNIIMLIMKVSFKKNTGINMIFIPADSIY